MAKGPSAREIAAAVKSGEISKADGKELLAMRKTVDQLDADLRAAATGGDIGLINWAGSA